MTGSDTQSNDAVISPVSDIPAWYGVVAMVGMLVLLIVDPPHYAPNMWPTNLSYYAWALMIGLIPRWFFRD